MKQMKLNCDAGIKEEINFMIYHRIVLFLNFLKSICDLHLVSCSNID